MKKPPHKTWPSLSSSALLPIVALGLATGCTVIPPLGPACRPESSSGNAPPTHCFYFPESMAIDPLGDVLYVANDNIDLSFAGATVVAVDLLRQERAVECFRRFGHSKGGDADCGQLPASCTVDPNDPSETSQRLEKARDRATPIDEMERLLAEAGKPEEAANFDRCFCDFDPDDPKIVNCESHRFILANETVKVGFFPTSMALLAEDPPNWSAIPDLTDLHRGLYLSVRGDPSITFIDVKRPLRKNPTGATPPDVRLDCGLDPGRRPEHGPGQPYVAKNCADTNHVQQTPDEVLIDPNDPGAGTRPRYVVPNEPSGVYIDRGCVERGFRHERGTFFQNDAAQNPLNKPACYQETSPGIYTTGTYYQYLVASHRLYGQVSAYDLGKNPTQPVPATLVDVSDPLLSSATGNGQRGGFALAPRATGDLSQPWYMTSRLTGEIATFRIAAAAGPHIVPGLSLSVVNQFSFQGTQLLTDVRDLTFTQGGNRAFAALFTPPALAFLDTSTRSAGGIPVNQVTGIVNLCMGPSRIAYADVPRQQMGSTVRVSRLYVTCHNSGQVAEVDAESGELIGTIPVGRGPLSIVLNFGQPQSGQGVDPCVDPYVSDAEAAKRGITCPTMGADSIRPQPPRPSTLPGQLGPRAYITSYSDNAIAVLDLDPRSSTYRRVTSRIGFPIPKQVQ